MQSRMAALADREALLRVKVAQDRPIYGGTAYAKLHNNLWKAVINGTAKIPSAPVPPPPAPGPPPANH